MSSAPMIWIGGFLNLAFFIFHIFFWKIFDWQKDLRKLTPINKAIMQVLNICLMFVFLVFVYVSFFHVNELLTTPLGKTLTLSIGLFWAIRAVLQVTHFSATKPRSIAFLVVFIFMAGLYILAYLG